jgi:cell division protein FtsB
MANRNEKASFKRFFKSRSFLLFIIIILLFISYNLARVYYQAYRTYEAIKQESDERDSLTYRNFQLTGLLKYVSSDQYVEDQARTELNLKKDGEQVIMLNNVEPQTTSSTYNQVVDERPLNNLTKWWYYFSHKQLNNQQ